MTAIVPRPTDIPDLKRAADPAASDPPPRHPLLVALIVAFALFMENMDSTIIATSLPVIALDLHENPIALKLALTSYLVSLAVFIPAASWVADRFGARRVFRWAVAIFMLGSALCGLCSGLAGFVAARFLQGLGGAMMVPVGRLVLLKTVPKNELVRTFAWLTIPALVGPLLGPPVGGFISTYFDWRWIFYINIPVGALGIVLAGRYIPEIREEKVAAFDARGFLLSGFGLALLTLGAATAGQHLLTGESSAACTLMGMILLALYVRHARAVPHPVLEFRFLRIPTYATGVLGGALFRIGVGATPFLLPMMLQIGFGFSALHSGLLTCASAAAAMFMKTLTTRILKQWGFRQVLLVNSVIAAATIGCYGLFTPLTPQLVMVVLLFLGGLFRSLQFTALGAITFADVARPDMGPASGLANVVQQLALSTGVTIGAYALQVASTLQHHAQLQSSDFSIAFVVVSMFSMASVGFAWRLRQDAGAEVSGKIAAT
jgi:EmrB/QacA subfamily drug resistance transporter